MADAATAPALPFIHVVTYGPPGSGKSTFAATFPKPMLVLAFDPLGKDAPYLERGIVGPDMVGDFDQPVVQIASRNKTGKLLVQLEYFHDTEVTNEGKYRPVAYNQFLKRFSTLYDEVKAGLWKTIVVDTLTFMELTARKLSQYQLNPTTKEPRQHYALSTEFLEEALMCRLGGMRTNVVILAHVDTERDEVLGTMLFNPAAPGRLRTRLGGGYPEMYYMRATREKNTQAVSYALQTRADSRYNCTSTFLRAPDPCEPNYAALWGPWKERNGIVVPS